MNSAGHEWQKRWLRLLALSRKELGDILREKVYLFAFAVQLVIVVGIIYTALLYTSITNPSVATGFIQSEVKVGVMGDLRLSGAGLKVMGLPPGDPFQVLLDNDLAAMLVAPDGYADKLMRGEGVEFTLYLDNTNILSGYADAIISNEVDRLSGDIERRAIAGHLDPDVVLSPISLKEIDIGAKRKPQPMEFVELMYGLLIPFILLLPAFLSTNMMTDSILGEKEKRTYEALLAAPLSSRDLILGKMMPILLITMLQVVTWITLLRMKGIAVYNVVSLLFLILLIDVALVGIGIAISAFSETIKDANAGVAVVILVVSLGFFAPISVSREAYGFSPVSLISRLASNPDVSYDGIISVYAMLAILSILTVQLGAKLLEWREDLRL
ncbi:MAG: ABC transporter permease [Candidatus Hydrothermarchaeaceae archaeon]